MCGYFGIICNDNEFDYKNITINSTELINHRGPDSTKFHFDQEKGIFVGFNRLKIIDLSEQADQPFFSSNKRLILLFNGEIYNFKDLRNLLIHKGFRFKTKSDTEVILNSYIYWGEYFIEYLEGMFSITVIDLNKNKVISYRDEFGIKPLYYFYDKNKIIFSSEFKVFSKLKYLLKFDLNKDVIENSIVFPFNFSDKTFFSKVEKLPRSQFISFDLKTRIIKQKKFFNKKNFFNHKSFGELFKSNFDMHLNSDVKISALFSGGIDSSVICKLLNNNSKDNFISFFLENNYENQFIEKNASLLNLKIDKILISNNDIHKNIGIIPKLFDDLTSSDPAILTNYIGLKKSLANTKNKVLLVGDGADEFLYGYSWFNLQNFPFNFISEEIKLRIIFYAYSRVTNKRLSENVFKRFTTEYYSKKDTNLDMVSNVELNLQLPNHYLMKVDKYSMMNSVECRTPFVSSNISNYFISLDKKEKLINSIYNPFSKKINDKYILRKYAHNELDIPQSIALKKKKGFGFYVPDIIKKNKDLYFDLISSKNSISSNFLEKKEIQKINNELLSTKISKQSESLSWRIFLSEFIISQI